MNTMTRRLGLLLLTLTVACVAEFDPPGEELPGASEAPSSVAPERAGGPFNPRIRAKLAARGIKVYGGREPERTTVEQAWIVEGFGMEEVQGTDSTAEPHKYATFVEIVQPLIVNEGSANPSIDPNAPGEPGYCSGTLVGDKAVLTAAHCVIDWKTIGKTQAGDKIRAIVRAYSHTVFPRRNGLANALERAPHGTLQVTDATWRFGQWPGNDEPIRRDHDFAVLELRTAPTRGPIDTATVREAPSTGGLIFEAVHYPYPSRRGSRMYYSTGAVGSASSDPLLDGTIISFQDLHDTSLSMEHGSSGGGIFEFAADGVVGLTNAQQTLCSLYRNKCTAQGDPILSNRTGQPLYGTEYPGRVEPGMPNRALMFSQAMASEINAWVAATN